MPRAFALLVALSTAATLGGCAAGHQGHAGHGGRPPWRDTGSLAADIPIPSYSLAEGKDLAFLQEKPMMVDFYAPEGCSRCDLMARHLWGNPEIARYVEEHFVLVRVDLTGHMTREEIELGRRYDYKFDCLLIYLDYRGEVLTDAGGGRMCFADFIEPETFLKMLSHAAAAAEARR